MHFDEFSVSLFVVNAVRCGERGSELKTDDGSLFVNTHSLIGGSLFWSSFEFFELLF